MLTRVLGCQIVVHIQTLLFEPFQNGHALLPNPVHGAQRLPVVRVVHRRPFRRGLVVALGDDPEGGVLDVGEAVVELGGKADEFAV